VSDVLAQALRPITDRITALDRRLRGKVSIRSATVTGVDPIRIRFDGESASLASTPRTHVPVGVGDRVDVAHHGGTSYTILSVVGGAGQPWRQAADVITITGDNTPQMSVPVTFPPGRFTDAPIVPTTLRNTHLYFSWPSNVTAAGFTVNVRRYDGGSFNLATATYWQAVQMTPTSAEG